MTVGLEVSGGVLMENLWVYLLGICPFVYRWFLCRPL
jgi:hypothetical protein